MSFMQEVEGDVVKANTFARAVVARRVAIVAVVTVLVQLAVNYGWFSIDVSNHVLHYLDITLTAVGAVVAIGVVHPAVTPTSDPRNDAGTALVPASQVEALIANAVAEAKGGHLSDAVDKVTQAADEAVADVKVVSDTVKEDIAPIAAVATQADTDVDTTSTEAPETSDAAPVAETPALPTVDDSDDVTVEETDPTLVLPPTAQA